MKNVFPPDITSAPETPLKTKIVLGLGGALGISILAAYVCFELGVFPEPGNDLDKAPRKQLQETASSEPVKDSLASITIQGKTFDPYANTVWFPETKRLFDSAHAMMAIGNIPEMMKRINATHAELLKEASDTPECRKIMNPDGSEDKALAERYYNKAMETRAKQKDVLLSRILQIRGYGYLKTKKYDLGIQDITDSIALNNDEINKKNYINRAQAYRMINRPDLAEADMRRSTKYSH